jgi:hypothetical protein
MKKKRKGAAGCYPECHYQYSREYVDFDYMDKLSDKDVEWLANFADNYYSGRFKKQNKKNPIKDRKEGYNRASKQRFDVMSGRFKSRVLLDKSLASMISEVDVETFKKFLEGETNLEVDGSDED